MTKSRNINAPRRHWTDAELAVLQAADKAVMSGDVVAMLQALETLKGIES